VTPGEIRSANWPIANQSLSGYPVSLRESDDFTWTRRTTMKTTAIVFSLVGAGAVAKLVKAKVSPEKGIETLYLATLSRRPSENEMTLMKGYIERRRDAEQGFRGVLWILFNTNEFVLNH
jgi:hypothetical protein